MSTVGGRKKGTNGKSKWGQVLQLTVPSGCRGRHPKSPCLLSHCHHRIEERNMISIERGSRRANLPDLAAAAGQFVRRGLRLDGAGHCAADELCRR